MKGSNSAGPKLKSHGQRLKNSGIDLPFFVLVIILLAIGLVMVFSASYAYAHYYYSDSYYFIKRQFAWAVLGVIIMCFTMFVNYRIYRRLAIPLLIISIILLIAVLPFGVVVNGAKRWLYLGPIHFQPSEITKDAVIIAFSSYIAKNQKYMKTFRKGILPFAAILGVISFLMLKEPHMSGTILIILVGIILMFVGGTNMKWLAGIAALGVAALGYIILFTDYMSARIEMWRNPFVDATDKGYQIIQSLYAIGSGGLLGLGLGQSRQKYLYLPEPQNDFIFAIVCEELGFVGAVIIMLIFALLVWRGFVIALKAPDKFSSLLVIGIITRVAIQTVLNIAVVTNAIPVTGISLPFFSYGGTSLVILLFEMGIVLNVSRYSYLEKT